MQITIKDFFDPQTATFTYVVHSEDHSNCAIVDSVLGYDMRSGRVSTLQADQIINYIRKERLSVQWHLETHVHADHLSAAAYLRQQLGGEIGISAHIKSVQRIFGTTFNMDAASFNNAPQFDHLFHDDEQFYIGQIPVMVMHTPGHTPADISFLVNDEHVFVGDTLFMPDVGTARCDFPGGDAATLYESIQRILSLESDTRLYLCHDYPPAQRPPRCQTTVGEQLAYNIHARSGISRSEFISMRTKRDSSLEMPALLLPSIQVNIRAGVFPNKESNGTRYLKIPLNAPWS